MSSLSPLFKWTGGKRREIKEFAPYFPEFVTSGDPYRFVEPFVGGGAVFWYLNNAGGQNIINDWDYDVVNFYRCARDQDPEMVKILETVAATFQEKVWEDNGKAYYDLRNLDRNKGLESLSSGTRAGRFFVVNQLAFSGMRRFNGKGEFNVPFGHYKSFNPANVFDPAHVALLKSTDIRQGDYSPVVTENDLDDTFIFVDPPYTRVMKTYSADNEFGDDQQYQLRDTLAGLSKAKFMVVIDSSELTRELYKDHIVGTYDLRYGVNIKNRMDTSVTHLVATNY